ncbi:MAG: hypothetical protein WBL25_09620 [Anaerolineales bacterium]
MTLGIYLQEAGVLATLSGILAGFATAAERYIFFWPELAWQARCVRGLLVSQQRFFLS